MDLYYYFLLLFRLSWSSFPNYLMTYSQPSLLSCIWKQEMVSFCLTQYYLCLWSHNLVHLIFNVITYLGLKRPFHYICFCLLLINLSLHFCLILDYFFLFISLLVCKLPSFLCIFYLFLSWKLEYVPFTHQNLLLVFCFQLKLSNRE